MVRAISSIMVRKRPALEMAVRFEQAFGGSAEMWLRMQAAFDLAQVRQHAEEMAIRRL